MKIILNIFFLLYCSLSAAQNSSNCFTWKGGNQADWYCFLDSTFMHINKTHDSFKFGKGIFREKADSLLFLYSNMGKGYLIRESKQGTADSIKIRFQIFDRISNEPIDRAVVFIDRIRIGIAADSYGRGEISISKRELTNSEEFTIQAIGYPTKMIDLANLQQNEFFNLEIWLSNEVGFFNEADSIKFSLLELSKNKFKMKNEFGYEYNFKTISLRSFEKKWNKHKRKRIK